MSDFSKDIAIVQGIAAVPTILEVVCRTTGMGFAAVARVTEDRWIACSVLDNIHFGLQPGGELKVESTICHEIRQTREPVIIDEVACDAVYRDHHTPRQYGFQSYISMPIFLSGGRFYGTLCAIDPRPAKLNTPEIVGMFKLFAELIASHIDSSEKLAMSESTLSEQRVVAELREQFIGVLGHDLRTPLWAVSMGATLLTESALDQSQADTVARIRRSVTRMSELIDDAMDFARGRLGGGITVERVSDEPIGPVLAHVVEEVRTTWPDRKVEFHFAVDEGIHYDRKRIAQLFTNLLSNAITHGKADRPVRVDARSHGGKFELSVANAADPIPPAVLARLFEPFSRGGADNYQQGLGLGLYIASEIAKSHGGTIQVASNKEETRFTFTMPTTKGKSTTTEQDPAPGTLSEQSPAKRRSAAGVRILLIEDHVDTLHTLTRLLSYRGHAVTAAADGALARAAFAGGTFDLIVSDIGLPDCSGFELIAEFVATKHIPAIAMTGYGMESDILNSKEAGFVEHLTKPVDFELLTQTIDRLARREG